jgi:Ca2+-binding RTX toxin-like protein
MTARSVRSWATAGITVGFLSLTLAPVIAGERPLCFGLDATIVGTPGDDAFPDAVFGTTQADVIAALAGSDNIYTVPLDQDPSLAIGDDHICAGPGSDDPVSGSAGNDRIRGGEGSDSVFGFSGNDLILGGPGGDEVEPHAGHDVVVGGADGDELCASPGGDVILGGGGDDRIGTCGGPSVGADRYYGGPGSDDMSSVDARPLEAFDVVDAGGGVDTCAVDTFDTVLNCETVSVGER